MELDGQKAWADWKHPLRQLQDKPHLMGLSICWCIQESLQFSTIAHCLGQPRPHAHRALTVGNNTNEEGSIPWSRESKGCNYSVSHWREGVLMFGESGGLREKLHPVRWLQCLSQVKRSLWRQAENSHLSNSPVRHYCRCLDLFKVSTCKSHTVLPKGA